MFQPSALFIGLRYTRAKRRNHFISFISLMSMLGIALGVIVLITVLSVMNGFDQEIKKRAFSLAAPLTIGNVTGNLTDWQSLQNTVSKEPNITATAPFVNAQVLLSNGDYVMPALINGIIPAEESKISELHNKMIAGSLDTLKPGEFGIILGEELASHLEANIGDKITVVTPQVSMSPAGVIPRFKRFTVTGIFKAGGGFNFDAGLGYIELHDAQKLLGLGSAISGLHLTTPNVYAAPQISIELADKLPNTIRIVDWTEQFGAFFHAVSLEKTMMFFILLLIIAVAVFNLVSTLVMVVNEKQSDIAILRTFGATPNMIMSIFMIQGAIIGVFGTLIGVVGGILLAWNVTDIVNWIEKVFHLQLISSNVYFVDYLPSQLQWPDVFHISAAALLLSFFATIYPAWRASSIDPVESLRYE